MRKQLIVVYDTNEDLNGLNGLIVVDPDEVLENGNFKVIKILLGDYADEVYRDLTEDKA